jgi:hypothetical protein
MFSFSPLAAIFGIFEWWQILLLVALIVLIVVWKKYRSKQM